MSLVNPLMHAVLANPEDDTPRMICADWLEEHGDEARGQFIRAQCELARLPAWDRRRQELAWLADDLRARHGARWRAELPALEGIRWGEFDRGFVSTVRVEDAETLYRHDGAVAAAAPVYRVELPRLVVGAPVRPKGSLRWMRAVRFVGYGDHRQRPDPGFFRGVEVLELLNFPQYGGLGYPQDGPLNWVVANTDPAVLTTLKVEGTHVVGRSFARGLAALPQARRLTRLALGTRFVDYNTGYFEDPTLGPEGAADLAGSSHLASLTALDLGRQRIGDAGLDALLSSPSLRGLRELELRFNEIASIAGFGTSQGAAVVRLDMSGNTIGDGGTAALAGAPRLAGLESLGLDTCEVRGRGVKALTAAPFWGTLGRLDLGHNPLGEPGAWALAEAAPPARLHALRLSDCDLDAAAMDVLATCPWLAGLQSLDLSGNLLKDGGILLLEGLAGGTVRELSLASTGLRSKSVRTLKPLWPNLVSLDLGDNDLGNALAALAAAGPARALQSLRLKKVRLPRESLEALAAKGSCPSLHTLVLSENPLGTGALGALLRSPLAGQLLELDLSRCSLTDDTARLLADTPAVAGLQRLNLRHNSFGEEALLALAQSPHLRSVPEILLTGNPWSFSPASRDLLARRFGQHWYYYQDEEEQEQEEYDE